MALQSRVRRYAMHWLRITQKSRERNKENRPQVHKSLNYQQDVSKNFSNGKFEFFLKTF